MKDNIENRVMIDIFNFFVIYSIIAHGKARHRQRDPGRGPTDQQRRRDEVPRMTGSREDAAIPLRKLSGKESFISRGPNVLPRQAEGGGSAEPIGAAEIGHTGRDAR